MQIVTSSFVDHRSGGQQDVFAEVTCNARLMVPGACTTCYGSTCSSCCGAVTSVGEELN